MDQHPEEAVAFNFSRHHYKIVLSVREDFLADLEALRPRMPTIALNRLRLERMNGDAALHVVNQAPHLIPEHVAERPWSSARITEGARRRGCSCGP